MAAQQSEESRYNLSRSVAVPRDPSEYRITDHFRFRKERRTNPSVTSDIIRECFEQGAIKNTQQADRFIFELERGYTWRVIVALRDEAFLNESEKHRALTVYAVDGDHDDEGWAP